MQCILAAGAWDACRIQLQHLPEIGFRIGGLSEHVVCSGLLSVDLWVVGIEL